MSEQVIGEALVNSVQSPRQDGINEGSGLIGSLLLMLAANNALISPWWSSKRDAELRQFWKKSDHLSGAMYAMTAKMTTIPIRVEARDQSIDSHVQLAETYTRLLLEATDFGEGWNIMFSKVLEDYLGQDNGCFIEVIGGGPKDGPIVGPAISLAHLDSGGCRRTGDPLFPVIYTNPDGKMYKLHRSRVIYQAQMPSADRRMKGVGYCAVSRAFNAAQNLLDIAVYKQEKLGSRPTRQLLITQGGLDPDDLALAIKTAQRAMDSQGLNRFSKSIAVGDRTMPTADIKSIDLVSLPDGFDERESTIMGMAVVAMAFGIDARELFPAMESGATKADAIVQHMKQRGKGPGQIIEMMERVINQKFLPPFLKVVFDYQDDAEDRQAAEIKATRAQTRQRNVETKITNERTERELMVQDGELSQEQFEALELADGRMPDGVSVEVLFSSVDSEISEFLKGVSQSSSIEQLKSKRIDIMAILAVSKTPRKIRKARYALAAVEFEINKKEEEENKRKTEEKLNAAEKPDDSYEQEKFGRKLTQSSAETGRIPDEEEEYLNE